MFFSIEVLTRKGPLARIWIAAHEAKRLKRAEVAATDLEESIGFIHHPDIPIALRTSGHLLLGVVRIYSKKVMYLLTDCIEATQKIRMQLTAPTGITLQESQSILPREAITLSSDGFGLIFPSLPPLDIDLSHNPSFRDASALIAMASQMSSQPIGSDVARIAAAAFSKVGLGSQQPEIPLASAEENVESRADEGMLFESVMEDEAPEVLRGAEVESQLNVSTVALAEKVPSTPFADGDGIDHNESIHMETPNLEISSLSQPSTERASLAPQLGESPLPLPHVELAALRKKRNILIDRETEIPHKVMRQSLQNSESITRLGRRFAFLQKKRDHSQIAIEKLLENATSVYISAYGEKLSSPNEVLNFRVGDRRLPSCEAPSPEALRRESAAPSVSATEIGVASSESTAAVRSDAEKRAEERTTGAPMEIAESSFGALPADEEDVGLQNLSVGENAAVPTMMESVSLDSIRSPEGDAGRERSLLESKDLLLARIRAAKTKKADFEGEVLAERNRQSASRAFLCLLHLATEGLVRCSQEGPFETIFTESVDVASSSK